MMNEDLLMAVRVYWTRELKNGNFVEVQKADVYTADGVNHYIYNGSLVPDKVPHSDYLMVGEKAFNWNRIPIIPFKYNDDEIPLIRDTKQLQDALNLITSNFVNNMDEDPRTTILVLKNYDGTNLAEFRKNLATYGVIKVRTVDGTQGGVDTLNIEVDANNYTAVLMCLRRAMIDNGRGFDAKEERMDGDPNEMNIQSMYTDIDLDINGMETEFQVGFEQLIWFIDQYLKHAKLGDFEEENVEIMFTRDIFINETELIENCVKSVGIISNATIIAHHPWVVDLKREQKLLEQQKAEEQAEMEAAFQREAQIANNQPKGKNGGDE